MNTLPFVVDEASVLIDKSAWPEGEWQSEPDHLSWHDVATGYECFIWRSRGRGHLCGYVAIPIGHPCDGVDYSDLDEIECHGGLTFSVRHNDNRWVVGFDCGNSTDVSPLFSLLSRTGATYKNMAYVARECQKLSAQLKQLEAVP